MTPKEKAQDLYGKMRIDLAPILAKESALIAVDELIQQCWDYREIDLEKSCDYWKEVKHEIEKL